MIEKLLLGSYSMCNIPNHRQLWTVISLFPATIAAPLLTHRWPLRNTVAAVTLNCPSLTQYYFRGVPLRPLIYLINPS